MEKINTIGKTITGLSEEEYNMIIRALKARAFSFQEKACEAKDGNEWYSDLDVSRAYSELAKFIEKTESVIYIAVLSGYTGRKVIQWKTNSL